MSLIGSKSGSLTLAIALLAGASTLSAQERRLFEWRGDVDREVQVSMRGREVWTRDFGNNESRRHRERVTSALPREDGEVFVRVADGRGDAQVIQQPSARNNYTTIVRIRDPRGGADQYRLDAFWEPYSSGGWGRNHRNASTDVWDRDGDGDYDNNDRGVYRGGNGRDRGIDSRDRSGERGPWGGANAGAGTRTVMHWSGDVDDVLEIRLQGQRAEYRTVSGATPRSIRADINTIPQRDVDLRVVERQGRGQVSVVQQPSARNGYTTVIRVNDPQGGYGFYDFDLIW